MGWVKEHLWETGFYLVFGALLLLVVLWSWNIFRPAKTDNALYHQLTEIMDERKRLWFIPRSDGGTREGDISQIVCPIVSKNILDEMYEDPVLSVSAKYYSYSVDYNYYEDGENIYPDRSHIWILKKRIFPISNQLLILILTDDGVCKARYRHQT